MYKSFIAALLFLLTTGANAQKLFSYGSDTVTVDDFMKAYLKNNAANVKESYKLNDYLDLYISSRLKIKEAKALGYDTLPQMVADIRNLREQIIPNFLNDEQAVKKLMDEAISRASKNIHVAHIFISFTASGVYDSVSAAKRLKDLTTRLQAGEKFEKLAAEFSDDPSSKNKGGDIGWIGVFTLPYELENLAYTSMPGKYSSIYRSRVGYHIFKNLGERPDPGKIKAAQILIAIPPNATDEEKALVKKRADSIYNRLLKGDDFGKLASAFSNDIVSAASQGVMTEFGVGEFDPVFENAAFSLSKDGALSKPFLTSHGWHILKRISRTPVLNPNDAASMESFRGKMESSDRMNITKKSQAQKIMKMLGVSSSKDVNSLYAYSDSILNNRPPAQPTGLSSVSVVLTVAGKNFTAKEWEEYARTFRYKSDGSGLKTNPELWNEFVETTSVNYYKDHLETFNPEFKAQVKEFGEGNLFFEIMQRKVWGPAQSDTIAQEKFYREHKSDYTWKKSADAIVFYASDKATAEKALKQLQGNTGKWKDITATFEEKLAADSNRIEFDQLPGAPATLHAKTFTPIIYNPADQTASFAYVLHVYNETSPKSFAEAKGQVINDYQAELEKIWVNQLRGKYPVSINQTVLMELMKKK